MIFDKIFAHDDLLNKFLEVYKPGNNLIKPDEKILEFGKKSLPKEIVELWTKYGFGEYGNGLIKIVDPRDYMENLYTWLGGKDLKKIPIIVTAFGDIFYYRRLENNNNDISLLNIHYRNISVCAYNYKDFFSKYLLDINNINGILRKTLYDACIVKFGNLINDEIFYFKPALFLGGKEDINYINKGSGRVHQKLLFDMGNK